MQLDQHPTVQWFREQKKDKTLQDKPKKVDAQWLRELCIQSGADDVGFIDINRPTIAVDKTQLLKAMKGSHSLVSMAFRVNREIIRTPVHSIVNIEFKQIFKHANNTARRIVSMLEKKGIRALYTPAGFPYEADRWPGKMWLTSDKIIAEEAGLGRMGWNRLVLHPQFGAAMVLGNVVLDAEMDAYDYPLDYNPCIECGLCVSVCPVGAIGSDGSFNFISCITHNYRERLGGFSDWVENIVSSKNTKDYRRRISDDETISMWQNLSIGAQTRCDRCMAVCPAGRDGIGYFMNDRKRFIKETVKPMQAKEEIIYVVKSSDAEDHVKSKYPNKTVKQISNGIRPPTAKAFLESLSLAFQRNQSDGLDATYHFTFTGDESCRGTAIICNKSIEVHEDHVGSADLHLIADSSTWVSFLAKEKNMIWAIITRKIRVKGPLKLMQAFARCFP